MHSSNRLAWCSLIRSLSPRITENQNSLFFQKKPTNLLSRSCLFDVLGTKQQQPRSTGCEWAWTWRVRSKGTSDRTTVFPSPTCGNVICGVFFSVRIRFGAKKESRRIFPFNEAKVRTTAVRWTSLFRNQELRNWIQTPAPEKHSDRMKHLERERHIHHKTCPLRRINRQRLK